MLNQMKKNHSQWGLHGQAHGWYHLQESQRRSREGEEHWQLHLSLKENSIILFGFFFSVYPCSCRYTQKQFSKHKPIIKFDSYSHHHDSNSTEDT